MTDSSNSYLIRSIASLLVASLLIYTLYLLLKPFLLAIMIGGVLTLISRPIYYPLYRWSKLPLLSALSTLLIVVLIILLPLTVIGLILGHEISHLSLTLQSPTYSLENINNHIVHLLTFIPGINSHLDIRAYELHGISFLSTKSSLLLQSLATAVGTTLLALITTFYLLQSHEQLRSVLRRFSPLAQKDTDLILSRTREVVWAAVNGNLVLVALQGLTSMLGFFVFGYNAPVLLGILYGVSSLVPTIGAGLVLIPVVVFEIIQGDYIAALGMVAWSLCQVAAYDSFIGPRLIQKRARLHPFLILLGILGGVAQFGFLGIILGPTIVALGIVGVEIWHHAWQVHPE